MRVFGIEWVIEDLTKSEVQQSRWTVVLDIHKDPLQGFFSVPAGSVLAVYCSVEVNYVLRKDCRDKKG